MNLRSAQRYLEDVLEKKRCIPFRKYNGCVAPTPQGKEFKHTQGRWPKKSVKVILDLLRNAESNAEYKSLETDNLYIQHIQVHEARQGRRKTYRAHGRIGPYMNCPCHVQMILAEKEEAVEKTVEEKKPIKFTKRVLAKKKLKLGGGL